MTCIKKLKVKNFRNYEVQEVSFPSNKIILLGKNAQGKTNLLEAVYYLATLSSFRSNSDSELIKWNESFAAINAQVYKNETDIELDVVISPPANKVLKLNGLKKSKYSQFIGNLIVVNFGITDLLLLRGTPSDRRKWLDNAISQIYPAYKERLNKYNKVRTQRNNLLKDFRGNINLSTSQQDFLAVINEQIAVSASNIIHLRQKYLKEIQQRAIEKHKKIALDKEELVIKYESSVTGVFDTYTDEIIQPDFIKESLIQKFSEKRNEEIFRAQTVIGPHRDDIAFYINNADARSFASQGQQRTIVLALKLSELDFITEVVGESPVLLLDDVLAELDSSRQSFLLDSIKPDTQVIITTTDISGFKEEYLKDVLIYNVESGFLST